MRRKLRPMRCGENHTKPPAATQAPGGFLLRLTTMANKEYNYAYNKGYYDGLAAARIQAEASAADMGTFALFELASVLTLHSGYARLGHSTQSGFWARYKWSEGTHAGFYTFGGNPALPEAIAALCGRVENVEAGKLKPTPDRPAWKR